VRNKISPFSSRSMLPEVDFQGSRVASDGGLILIRELDERLGLEKLIDEHLSDSRQGLNKQFTLADLLRHRSTALGGLRGPQRRRTTGNRPDVSIDQLTENLGPGRGADLFVALVRDRAADPRRESDRADGVEPGDAGAGRFSG